jgi:hypothetical protein
MSESSPHFQRLSDELNQVWQSASAAELANEISELSQTNRLQTGLLNRLAAKSGSVDLTLNTGEVIAGIVMLIGTDALLIKTTATNSLIPINSVVTIANLGKAKSLNRPKQQILIPLLLRHQHRKISVFPTTAQPIVGKLVAVWSDSIDLKLENEVVSIALTNLVKLELS